MTHSTRRKIKILIVDDDRDVCEHLEQLLTKENFLVTYTTDPSVTVSILEEELFQIIILDIIMPKLDGLELLTKIRQIDKDICVVLLSGYPTFERAVIAMRGLAFDFLTKPFEIVDLVGVLTRATKHYGLQTNLNQEAIEQIAREVRRLRLKRKLSLRQLANRTGLSSSLLSQVEHAKSSPSIATVSRLAAALDSPLEKFFNGL